MVSFLDLIITSMISFGLTVSIGENPVFLSLKEQVSEHITNINIRTLFDYGSSCGVCRSFWISLGVALVLHYPLFVWLAGWGMTVLLIKIISLLEDYLNINERDS